MTAGARSMRFAMIGCGRVARELHLPAWSTLPQAQLALACDPSPAARDGVLRCYPRALGVSELEEVLERKEELDFVVLGTPGDQHARAAERLLAEGLSVLCEKPLTLDAPSAHRLFDLAAAHGVTLCPIHNYRFKSNSLKARLFHRAGLLGDIDLVTVRFRSGSLFDEPARWMRDERGHRALLFEIGYHFVDLALLFLGPLAEIRTVDADEDSMGLRYVVFTTVHQNGARGQFELMVDAKCRSTDLEIFGENGALALQFFPDGLRSLPGRDSPLHRCVGEARRLAQFAAHTAREKLGWGIARRAIPHARLFAAFLSALRGEGRVPVGREDAMLTLETLDQVARRAYRRPAVNRSPSTAPVSAADLTHRYCADRVASGQSR
ncbi:MAG TPA: Gfo/Idh/MocA family oxidoreductase [Candidatus Binataceae bacterium]|jgi:predicted dehydrogenase|nr:Gfo/Idh/MocA family oxidoreductase [Candidatus Binataceae bacterium]